MRIKHCQTVAVSAGRAAVVIDDRSAGYRLSGDCIIEPCQILVICSHYIYRGLVYLDPRIIVISVDIGFDQIIAFRE